MNTLIINTANENLEIVLKVQNQVFCEVLVSKSHHNETMLPAIDQILKQHNLEIANISQLGVVIGPGSFTGIRVGIATIKAFRDSLNIEAKGINNLDYLFSLAASQNPECNTVAILGSKDSYFVATKVNGKLYKYERNLTGEELKHVAANTPIGKKYFSNWIKIFCWIALMQARIKLLCQFTINFRKQKVKKLNVANWR